MNQPAVVDLKIPAGDTLTQPFRILEGGVPVDLTTATVTAELQHPRTLEIVPLDVTVGPAAGEFTLLWGDTEPSYGHYRYDIEITQNGTVRTWITGRFHVARDVTNAVA